MNKKYFVVTIKFNNKYLDKIDEVKELAFSSFLCDGIEEYSLEEKKVDELLGMRSYSGGNLPLDIYDELEKKLVDESEIGFVKFYFCSQDPLDKSQRFVSHVKENFKDFDEVLSTEKEEEDWNEEWKKHYDKIEVTNKTTIIPSWKKSDSDKNGIYIYPGQGFGTGNHETTFMCLKAYDELSIENSDIDGEKCLDFGCGSGILGIRALRDNFEKVFFYDIDKMAIENCRMNLGLNDAEDSKVALLDPSEKKELDKSKFKVVFANILLDTLKQEKNNILSWLENDSFLIISGILRDQIDEILKEYIDLEENVKLELYEKYFYNDWASLVFRRK